MKRILLTTFFLFSCFYAQARHLPEAVTPEKPLLGHFCQNCPGSQPEKLLYLVEVQQGYILFLAEKPCQSLYPLGYVDGFGLYGGYFAEGFNTDPWGLLTVDAKCGKTKVGKVTVSEYKAYNHDDEHGVGIKANFTPDSGISLSDKPCCCDDVRWVQVLTSNMRGLLPDKVESWVDPEPGQDDSDDSPYYFDDDDSNGPLKVKHWRKDQGGLNFGDRPTRRARGFQGKKITLEATLCLVCVKKDVLDSDTNAYTYDKIVPLACIKYGFTATKADGAVKTGLKEAKEIKDWKTAVDNFGDGWGL